MTFDDRFAELLSRIDKHKDAGFDISEMREEIQNLHDLAENDAQFTVCLGLFKSLMALVERQGVVDEKNIEEYRELAHKNYMLLLIKENVRGRTDGNIDPVKWLAMAEREVKAGRMEPDDELIAMARSIVEPQQSAVPKKGFWKKLLGT